MLLMSIDELPLVSFLICVRNGKRQISSTIYSAFNQTYPRIEVVVVNDGSTDGTLDVLHSQLSIFGKRLKIFSNVSNLGLTKSLNIGISNCSGEYIARLDCGDIAHQKRVATQVDILRSNKKIKLVGSSANVLNKEGYVLMPAMKLNEIENCLLVNPFAHSSAMFEKNAVLEIGGYDETFDTSQDFELWMRMYKKYAIHTIAEPLVDWVWADDGISSQKKWRQLANSIRARFRHNSFISYPAVVYQSAKQIIIMLIPNYVYKKIKML